MRIRGTGVLAVAVALAIGGCGGSSKSSSSTSAGATSSATSSTTSTASATTSAANGPLSKAQYEAQLGPLLNGRVAPALKTALSNGGIANPARLSVAIVNVRLAHDRMAAVNPPAAIAQIHAKAVKLLGSLVGDLTKLREAEVKKSRSDALTALNAIKRDGQTIVTIGSEFTARGF